MGAFKSSAKLTGKHLCQSLFFNKVAEASNFIEKETLAQVFFCEFCEISNNNFNYRTPLEVASRKVKHNTLPFGKTKYITINVARVKPPKVRKGSLKPPT